MSVRPEGNGIALEGLRERLGGELRGRSDARLCRDVRLDSREAAAGVLFAALPGARVDGADFAPEAVRRGALGVLTPRPLAGDFVQWIHADARRVAGLAAALVHGEPSRALTVVATTGTNGKTTVTHFVAQLLERAAGKRCAVLGTAGNRLADGVLAPANLTTADAPALQRLMARHRALGGDALALEASSHALDQERLAGLDVDVAVFTNLTRDHLDYHGDLARYAASKAALFAGLRRGASAVVRGNDPAAAQMIAAARAAGAHIITYGIGSSWDLCASRLEPTSSGTTFLLSGMGISGERIDVPMTGRFNVENALAAAAASISSGASPSATAEGLATVFAAPGRLERVALGDGAAFEVYVDYAHTPDALENVAVALREVLAARAGEGRLIVVFGCGGERDPGKRAPMGAVVDRLADLAVVTSDNPRGEDPARIVAAVLAGMDEERCERRVEVDRRRAIHGALAAARAGDIVLVAGKGHETVQKIGGRELPFDDRQVVREEWTRLGQEAYA